MRRLVPYPALALGLFFLWLVLTQSVSVGQIVLGTIVALFATQAMARLRPPAPTGRRLKLRPVAKLAGIVVQDILRSNVAVGAILLFRRQDRISGFIRVPLDLQDRHGLAILALIVTATPGTLWVDFDRRRSVLLLHVLDLVDEEHWILLIKTRYEALLLEIFGQ